MTHETERNTARQVKTIIRRALREDVGCGDATANYTISAAARIHGTFLAKGDGVVAGLEIARETFAATDKRVKFTSLLADGSKIHRGDVLARVSGPGRAILSAERTALNFLQRMSGIATATREMVDLTAGFPVVILDTRKTAPGLRVIDKMAVKLGGGENHRMGLDDMILIKDNHIAAVGSITAAVGSVRRQDRRHRPIEVEVTNLAELAETLPLRVDRILLDNMSLEEMKRAAEMAHGITPLEASGNITRERIRDVAETGVDFISAGALTHSVKALDISLEIGKDHHV